MLEESQAPSNPARDPVRRAMQSASDRLPSGKQEPYEVLIVDDESELRLVLCCTLRAAGYRVWEASGGDDALKLIAERNGELDLLVTDLKMPGMDGRELAEQVTMLWPKIRVLYMSGYAEHTLPPGSTLLAKPFRMEAFKDEVERALARQDTTARWTGT